MTIKAFRTMVASLVKWEEKPHFERFAFYYKKKIVFTLDEKKKLVCIKLDELNQHVFSVHAPEFIYPAEGTWGKQGMTYFNLEKIKSTVIKEAILTAIDLRKK